MSRPRIISYLWFPLDSSVWKFRVIIFVASNLGSTIFDPTLFFCFEFTSSGFTGEWHSLFLTQILRVFAQSDKGDLSGV